MERSTRRCTTSNSCICTLVKGKIEKPDVAERTPRNPRVSISISQICECVCWKNVNVWTFAQAAWRRWSNSKFVRNLKSPICFSDRHLRILSPLKIWDHQTQIQEFTVPCRQMFALTWHKPLSSAYLMVFNFSTVRVWKPRFVNFVVPFSRYTFHVGVGKKNWSHHLISLTPRSVSKGYQKHLFVGPMEIQNYCAKKKSHMWALHWSKKAVMFNAIGTLGTFMQFPPSGFPRKGLTLNECIMNTSVVWDHVNVSNHGSINTAFKNNICSRRQKDVIRPPHPNPPEPDANPGVCFTPDSVPKAFTIEICRLFRPRVSQFSKRSQLIWTSLTHFWHENSHQSNQKR